MKIAQQVIELAKKDELPILIAGATASGKSTLAMTLAQRLGGVVVNADALQVYDCWRLLTARPSAEEEASAPHLLYGHVDRDTAYSVGRWLREVSPILQGKLRPIIVGGTGLYFSSLTSGLADIPSISAEVRAHADGLTLKEMVEGLDEPTRAVLDVDNRARVQRAWEVLTTTGRGLSNWQADTGAPLIVAAHRIVLHQEKDILSKMISERFDKMIDLGALDEVSRELPYWTPSRPSGRAIGVAELASFLRGERSLDEAKDAAKLATRQYARKQRKWFRTRMKDWKWIDGASG